MTQAETATAEVTLVAPETWDGEVAELRAAGLREANRLRRRGRKFLPVILAPDAMRGGGRPAQFGAASLALDWKIAAKLQIVGLVRSLLTKMYMIESLDPSLAPVLGAALEGKGLFEHNIGEFFLLYGRFEQMYGVAKGAEVRAKMVEILKGDTGYFKTYQERGKDRSGPLPYVVRNVLSHIGNSPTTVTREELRQAVDLLKGWTSENAHRA
ncbi:MAG: hypothetical protein OXH52_07205 [Gammaproteobacteria bacterium]|nr:hypothetical protein [Gammaproteobacteria bacterium]